jgi:hypothetical protein
MNDISDSEESAETTGVEELMGEFKGEIAAILPAISELEAQISCLKRRIHADQSGPVSTEGPVPIRSAAVALWCGRSAIHPTEFLKEIMTRGTVYSDMETRTLLLNPPCAEALGLSSKEPVSLFALLREFPRWIAL